MPWSLFPLGRDDAWLLPVLSLLAFALVVLWGQHLPGRGASLAIGAIGLGFVLFWFVLADLLASGPALFSFPWLNIPSLLRLGLDFPGFELRLGIIVDPLSALMLGIVTFVALMVQVYSLGYMRGEPRFGWYFAAHALFAASMLGLVLADNFLVLYIAWELVGLCSYLLIGFWYERRAASEAAKKAFITTRVGDVGFLVGILLLFQATGTFFIPEILQRAQGGELAPGVLTAAALLIFLGAMGKSAQFPLHVWLPDAMEGPTPVSALIHAATMVAAGVYLVARSFPLFLAAPGALEVVTAIGLITTLLAATLALVTPDIKRVLAYSTVSQLGFMMLGLGSGALGLTAAMFHLFTHAFFKALLFLGAGSVIHSTKSQDIWQMGGLARRMPITAVTFTIGALAMAGVPLLSGFWSKEAILSVVLANQHPVVFGLALVSALLSALYMARVTLVAFFGRPRSPEVYHHAHESPPVMTVPLVLLAALALVAGALALDPVGQALGLRGGMGSLVYLEHPEPYHVSPGLALGSSLVALLGLALGWAIYGARLVSAEAIARSLGPFYRLAVQKYYLDDLYQALVDRVVLVFSDLIALFDRQVVNDTGVDGTANATVYASYLLRYHETGKFYNYALGMVLGIVFVIVLIGALRG